jgi:hypothetical protein
LPRKPARRKAAWRGILRRVVPGARLARGASARALAAARSALSVSLPPELSQLLSETNGVGGDHGVALVFSVADLVSQNRAFREPAELDLELYKPFDSLLFFGAEGNGDLFAYDQASSTIVRWDHETDERPEVARDLEQYLRARAEAASGDAGAVDRSSADLPGQVVSVWVGQFQSPEAFKAYIELGGSGRTSEDGLPQSPFHAEFGLTLKDALRSTQYVIYVPRPTGIQRLLADQQGAHSFVAEAARLATAAGQAKANAAILLYGISYERRPGVPARELTFVGSFEFE